MELPVVVRRNGVISEVKFLTDPRLAFVENFNKFSDLTGLSAEIPSLPDLGGDADSDFKLPTRVDLSRVDRLMSQN